MELLDIVDENGTPIGRTVEREEAHRKGIRHRTAHVWLLREGVLGTEVLLQKRSENKDSFPGCYDISSAGHIPAGADYLASAVRELKEELGIVAGEEELQFCGQRRFCFRGTFYGRPFVDNQISNIYCLWRDVEPKELRLQREEVESVLWMDLAECKRAVAQGRIKSCIYPEELALLPDKRGSAG